MKNLVTSKVIDALSITLIMLIIYLCINLLYEIINVKQLCQFSFVEGYFIINNKPVGHHLYSYVVAFFTSFFAILYSHRIAK